MYPDGYSITTIATAKILCSSRICDSDSPTWSFQKRVMTAMGKRVIWRKENA
jgi:hypothetical protein